VSIDPEISKKNEKSKKMKNAGRRVYFGRLGYNRFKEKKSNFKIA